MGSEGFSLVLRRRCRVWISSMHSDMRQSTQIFFSRPSRWRQKKEYVFVLNKYYVQSQENVRDLDTAGPLTRVMSRRIIHEPRSLSLPITFLWLGEKGTYLAGAAGFSLVEAFKLEKHSSEQLIAQDLVLPMVPRGVS